MDRKLDAGSFSDPEVVRASRDFVCLLVDCTVQGSRQELQSRYDVNAYPSVLFLDPAGKEVERFTGNQPAAAVLERMKRALLAADPAKGLEAALAGRAGEPWDGIRAQARGLAAPEAAARRQAAEALRRMARSLRAALEGAARSDSLEVRTRVAPLLAAGPLPGPPGELDPALWRWIAPRVAGLDSTVWSQRERATAELYRLERALRLALRVAASRAGE